MNIKENFKIGAKLKRWASYINTFNNYNFYYDE